MDEFSVGYAPQACTKGVWERLHNPDRNQIDSEDLLSAMGEKQADSQLRRPRSGRSRLYGHPRQVCREEDQQKWNPRAKEALEHLQASIDDKRNKKEIHEDDDGQEREAGRERGRIPELREVDPRDDREDHRRTHGMRDESCLQRGHRHANEHDGPA